MTDVEYRAWITVPGLPLAHEAAWQPLIAHMESAYSEYGPVISWYDDGARIVLSADAPSETDAAQTLYDAVAESLRAVGLTERYPSAVAVEPAGDHAVTPA